MSRGAICAVAVCAAFAARAQSTAEWAVTRNAHFEVYAQAGAASATSGLAWLEELRGFVKQQTGLDPDGPEPLRVIAFRAPADYGPYRLESMADAYYVGYGSRSYLVLPSLDPDSLGTAAHEYGHFLFHLAGLDLPPWLREGMADVLSSVSIRRGGARIGGDLADRAQLLKRSAWLPLQQVLTTPELPQQDGRDAVELFYSESWALTEMLAFAPEYRAQFRELVTTVAGGTPGAQALQRIYGKSLAQIAGDLRARAAHRMAIPLSSGASASPTPAVSLSSVSSFDIRLTMARVLLLARNYSLCEELYNELWRESPDSADVSAGLGALAFARGDRNQAQRLWRRAVQQGLSDADVAFQYALLLDHDGGPADDLRTALELVVRLRPTFEEARFRLALLEESSEHHAAAVAQFEAIGTPSAGRAYPYWCAMAQALNELGRNDDAARAAEQAARVAVNEKDRAHALQFLRIARTRPDVQFTQDADGKLIMTTTRVPTDAKSWNAFIQPDDDLRRAEGTLHEIECADSGLGLLMDTASGRIAISIPDPSHVEMRNAPPDFVCGVQPASRIVVEYAADKRNGSAVGVARGIEFAKDGPLDPQ